MIAAGSTGQRATEVAIFGVSAGNRPRRMPQEARRGPDPKYRSPEEGPPFQLRVLTPTDRPSAVWVRRPTLSVESPQPIWPSRIPTAALRRHRRNSAQLTTNQATHALGIRDGQIAREDLTNRVGLLTHTG